MTDNTPRPLGGFKVEGRHRPECWGHEAGGFVCPRPSVQRDSIGRKGGSTEWFMFACNDPGCDAVALVRWDVLTEFVNRGVSR